MTLLPTLALFITALEARVFVMLEVAMFIVDKEVEEEEEQKEGDDDEDELSTSTALCCVDG